MTIKILAVYFLQCNISSTVWKDLNINTDLACIQYFKSFCEIDNVVVVFNSICLFNFVYICLILFNLVLFNFVFRLLVFYFVQILVATKLLFKHIIMYYFSCLFALNK